VPTFALDRRRFCQALAALTVAACQRSEPSPHHSAPAERGPADLLILGGRVLTMDPRRPEAEALAIANGRILSVGDRALIEASRGPHTRVLDLHGGCALPGLTDAHAHLIGLGRDLEIIDLRDAAGIPELLARLRAGAPAAGWVLGRGWDQNRWSDPAMPDHRPLSEAFPDRPVWLVRIDGHAGWANQAALALAGIDHSTPDPPGGELLRDDRGHPTGVLIDGAMALLPAPIATPADLRRQLLAAQAHVLARGLTGVHEMGVDPAADAVFRELAASGQLHLRVHGYADQEWFARELHTRAPDPISPESRYQLTGVKIYADGALGSRGAALLAPYSDRPDHSGLLLIEPQRLEELVLRALRGGWQPATHAIGDRGNRVVLDAYARALAAATGLPRPPRMRLEHAQILDLADLPRLAELGVIASMQPTHATSDMAWVPARVGPQRLAGAYAWRRVLGAGAHLAFGSDFPVELPEPTHGLYAALTRQDPAGAPEGGWLPDQRLDLDQALAAFTRGAAYAAFRDDHLGLLAPGYQADLTCFTADLHALSPTALRSAPVLATIIAGHPAYALA
jgi:predicted amidohydrolase YtcJ